MSDAAAAWLATLQARGVRVELRKNRIWFSPPNAYKDLSDDELLVLRHHRDDIKALLAVPSDLPPTAAAAVSTRVARSQKPAPPSAAAAPVTHFHFSQPTYEGDSITLDQWKTREEAIRQYRQATSAALPDSPFIDSTPYQTKERDE